MTCYTIFYKHVESEVVPLLPQSKLTERANSTQYLGIYLDCKISWSEHIKELCSKVSKLSGVFYHMASFKDADMVRQLYYACLSSH